MRRSRATWAFCRAEFLKIFAFRFPLYATAGMALFIGLVACNLAAAEHVSAHIGVSTAATLLPYLAWASWGKLVIVPIFLITFATYCTVVDSQYGMVRIGCSQPVARIEYAAAKTAAILAHSVFCVLFYTVLLLVSSAAIGRNWRMTWLEAVLFLTFCFRLVVLSVGIAWFATAAAMMRRTLLTGVVTAFVAVIAIAWLNVLPPGYGLRPYLLLRYFLYPLAPIWPSNMAKMVEIPNAGCTLWQFLMAATVVPAVCWLAAATYFSQRDITE